MSETEDLQRHHLNDVQVAAYLDRALAAPERAEIDAHLARCAQCRIEVVEVARIHRARARRKRWYVVVPVAAAAAVILLLVTGRPGGTPGQGVIRGDGSGAGAPRLGVVAPQGEQPVSPNALVFIWRAAGPDAHYQFTLTDSSGTVILTGEGADTTLVVPENLTVRLDRVYFWHVDALLANGSSVTTGVQRFRTTR